MQQSHYVHNLSVVPVEGLSTRELFDCIKSPHLRDWQMRDIEIKEIKEGQEEIIRRLQKWIPDFIDDIVQAGDTQCPNIFSDTNYKIILPNGIINAFVKVLDDLGKYLLEDYLINDYENKSQREEIADIFNKRSGVVVHAYYCWRGNEGKGVQLGRFQQPSAMLGFSNNDYSMAFRTAINALCQGIDLTEEVVRSRFLSNPLSYCDGINEIDALLRDVSLQKVRAADQPVGEFMAWMQQNAAQINTMGELVRLAAQEYLAAQRYEQRAKAEQVVIKLPEIVKGMGDRYLELAQIASAELLPPQNNRMEYLVN